MARLNIGQGRWSAAALVCACLWTAPAGAAAITVDWDVVPHADGFLDEATPSYECYGEFYAGRFCRYLWQSGLELFDDGVGVALYDDRFVDATYHDIPESEIPGEGIEVRPRCESTLAPCFDVFTPLTLQLWAGAIDSFPVNVFVTSSRGGVVKLPDVDGRAPVTITFSGAEWTDVDSLFIGMYRPAFCEGQTWPDIDPACKGRVLGFYVDSLTFDADVPEPGAVALLASGLFAVVRRYRRR